MKDRLFTKSAFKVALKCPAALYYYRDPDTYANQDNEDEFLKALAKGGFQVGDIAKLYCHVDEGCDLSDYKGYDDSLVKTNELFRRENVIIAEAAFRFGNMFVRTDIIVKEGNHIRLIEVKAKSWDGSDGGFVSAKNRKKKNDPPRTVLKDGYGSYLYDVAFQKYVVQHYLDEQYGVGVYQVSAELMMADKSAVAEMNAMNQQFRIVDDKDGRSHVERMADAARVTDYPPVVRPVCVDDECQHIYDCDLDDSNDFLHGMTFEPFVNEMCRIYCAHERRFEEISKTCFACPFYATEKDEGKKDGFNECWKERANFTDDDFMHPIIDEMNGTGKRRGDLITAGKLRLKEIVLNDLLPKSKRKPEHPGLLSFDRQWLHAAISTGRASELGDLTRNVKDGVYLDVTGLRNEMATWKFPLHMIDFETSAVALPFYAGLHPYETVAFQFSHHIIDSNDGGKTYTVRHAGQYINTEKGYFPNFDFVRELKRQLEQDDGTIFRYCSHENTVLNHIWKQLDSSQEPDKQELMNFIRTITHWDEVGVDGKTVRIAGDRDMVDLWAMIKWFYWHPLMKGSNSIKAVLPAILNSSHVIQEKYSRAIYGSEIPSKNIPASSPVSWIEWIQNPDGTREVVNPYKQLPPISEYFPVESRATVEAACEGDDREDEEYGSGGDAQVNNGGAALWAYGMLQFSDRTHAEALTQALLRYCELDTLAMVFIWEYFNEQIKSADVRN